MRDVWCGPTCFSGFERVLGCPRKPPRGAAPDAGGGREVAEICKEPGSRSRPKCVITPKGTDLVPAVVGLLQWGDRYRADTEGPAVLARHRGCGARVDAQIRCKRGRAVQAQDIESAPGPALRMRPAE